MPKIRRIVVKNFRSILELEMDAKDLTVIVGDNDCGKSNVLRALNLFFNDQTNPDQEFSFAVDYNRFAAPRSGRAPEVEVQVDLELPENYRATNGDLIRWRKRWRADGLQYDDNYWGVRLTPKKRGAGFKETKVDIRGRSKVPSLLSRIQFEYVPAVRSAAFFRTLRGRIFRVIADTSEQSVRQSSGDLENVISEAVSGLIDDIGFELDDISRLSLPNDLTPLFESLDFLAGEKSISLENRGDGIKARYIPLILKFIAERSREATGISATFIWAYEEPENNLEFRRAQELADAFYKLAADDLSQVLLTTHSPIFYNMHETRNDKELCTAYHLTKDLTSNGTVARSAAEAQVSLDESMGAMAIIAPYIKAAQLALSEAMTQASDLSKKLAEHNPDNLPALFVEGSTDFVVFKRLFEEFRPEMAQQVFFVCPPSRAGANYVANMLRAWEYQTKHEFVDNRRKAVGIIDDDPEGRGALKRFQDEVKSPKHVSLLKLDTPSHLIAARKLGLDIPVSLEELWPKSVWEHAQLEGWLADRPSAGIIGQQLVDRLIAQDDRISDIMDDEWVIYFKKFVEGNDGSTAKSDWAKYITEISIDNLEPVASEALKMVDRVIEKLGLHP
ncbi:hypothetical protein OAN307_c19370 [Octadecabacter antarcticus 307]|uniref:Endonuclease GajA/Old nuclease/RecF-like AAA domain-containing protein n=1 Tax=Octadecabacter antarcticus 307 TaxID=391626 RepID=M9RB20_9RHOB|nr:AAA family ATPase [Octadecabacter antarcticus]AGI67586.1 hypothetical protein OAN307_c19370 [Octadecabacter antarcticus 307]